ncbi:MAG: ABC transporter permease [Flavitalea sp.]
MKRNLLVEIAYALLTARWRQTLVAAVGVCFSVTMFIALMGFMTGLNDMLDNLILNRTPHVRLFQETMRNPYQPIYRAYDDSKAYHFIASVKTGNSQDYLKNSVALVSNLHKDVRVIGFSQKIHTPVYFHFGKTQLSAVIDGIDVQAENALFHFNDYLTQGKGIDLSLIPNSVILGKSLAEKMLLQVGDLVYVTAPGGESFPLKLVGFYQSGINELDKIQAYTSLRTARKLLGKQENYLTDIQIKLNDIALAPAVAREYEALYRVQAEDIQTANAQFETGSFIRLLISYVVGITLLTVAGFGIYNILNMLIYEKMDTIAILKATGFSGRDVKKTFLLVALSIGSAGGIIGLILGYGLSAVIDQIPFRTEALPTVKTYPINYNIMYYGIGLLFALVTTYVAGLLPAAKAARIDPVAIIRGK